MATAQSAPDPEQERTENIVKLLRVLFHVAYCEENDIAPPQKVGVLPAHFCGWLDSHMNLRSGEDECRLASVPYETWDQVKSIVSGGIAPEQLASVWYTIVLADRPKHVYPIKAVNTFVLITWADGTISPINAYVTNEMVELQQDKCFTDDLVIQILANNMRMLVSKIAEEPFDRQHDAAAGARFTSAAPEDPYEVLMGVILKTIPQLRPELQDPVRNYMRLCQGFIRPVVPARLLQEYQARMAGNKAPATGGWDAPPG